MIRQMAELLGGQVGIALQGRGGKDETGPSQ